MQMSYTKQAENAIRYAAKIVKEMNHPYIGTEHLLLDFEMSIPAWRDRSWRRTGWRKEASSGLWMN